MNVPTVWGRAVAAAACLCAAAAGPAAKNLSEDDGLVLVRPGPDKPWGGLDTGADVPPGKLLLTMPGAKIAGPTGAVELSAHGNLDGASPFPIIETAVTVNPPGDADLDVTLDRGRIDLANVKDKPAKVTLRFRDAVWGLTLEPKAKAALELYGLWCAGDGFRPDAKPEEHAPTAEAVLIVYSGAAELEIGRHSWRMHAPPGPASFAWHSESGPETRPHKLDKLPAWAEPSDFATAGEDVKKRLAVLAKFRKLRSDKSLAEAVSEFMKSKDPDECRVAVYAVAAMDELKLLGPAVMQSDDPKVYDHVVVAVRHWLGRGPGQDQKFYRHLIEHAKLTPAQAETVMHLLHDPGEIERGRPETYQVLIDDLDHPVFPVRALAAWHLKRLVPAGKDIAYDPRADEAGRAAAVKAWQKLVPPGTLPKSATN